MIRRNVLLAILILFTLSARGQVLISLVFGDQLNSGKVEFGLDGGFNFASQSGVGAHGYSTNFNLGFYFDIKMKDTPWMIHTGVIVKGNMGSDGLAVYSLNDPSLDNSFSGGNVERIMNYFNVPVMMKYNFKNRFFLEAGPTFGLLYGAHDRFTNTINGQELRYEVDIRDQYNALDAGLTSGIGYRLMKGMGMNLGVRYYFGFVNVAKQGPSVTNQSLYLAFGIPIGAGKAKERDAKKQQNGN